MEPVDGTCRWNLLMEPVDGCLMRPAGSRMCALAGRFKHFTNVGTAVTIENTDCRRVLADVHIVFGSPSCGASPAPYTCAAILALSVARG
jgi:hypothetical protein